MAEQSSAADLAVHTQRWAEAFGARDFDSVMSRYARDAVFVASETGLGPFEGRAAIRDFFEDFVGAYEDFELEAQEVRDLGGGVAFSVIVQRGRVRGSTAWVQLRLATVATWVDGLIERHTGYGDIDQGRAAAQRLAAERG
jgi:ketosteroid isomerase-like protein